MFREMRRKNQLLSQEESVAILQKSTSGVLALLGDEDYPYAVPLSYVFLGDKIYFHAAKVGHKIDAIKNSNKASFCVIDKDQVAPEEYTTYFRSVIVFGKIWTLDDPAQKRQAIETLALKYSPGREGGIRKEIDKEFDDLCMIELRIEHMTGKEAVELMRRRNK